MFRGTFTAVVTPFRNGDIDFAAFEKLIEAQIAAGITGIVAVGTTGESPTLTHDEKHDVIERTIKLAKGRCQVIAGAGTNSTRDSIEATRIAEKAGADGALLVAPYYNKPSQEGLFRDFKSAENLHRRRGPLLKDLFIEPNPVPVKTALAWRGAIAFEVRLPPCEMTETNQARLRNTLDAFEKSK